jgi:hypothetical protein
MLTDEFKHTVLNINVTNLDPVKYEIFQSDPGVDDRIYGTGTIKEQSVN